MLDWMPVWGRAQNQYLRHVAPNLVEDVVSSNQEAMCLFKCRISESAIESERNVGKINSDMLS